MKRWLRGIIVCLLGVIVLGGCQTMPKITKEQQNNIVTRIARRYEIHSVEFISFTQDNSTGSYYLLFKINNEDERTGISLSSPKELDEKHGTIALGPISQFVEYERNSPLQDTEPVDLSTIKIKYLDE